jgi:hypothetical protein
MTFSTPKQDWFGRRADWLPIELTEEGARVFGLTALCFGKGALLLQAQSRRGIAVERVGDTAYHEIISNALSKQDIERIALRVGHDAATAHLLRRVLEQGGELYLPEIDAWARETMRAEVAT